MRASLTPILIILLCLLGGCQNGPQNQTPAPQATSGPSLRAPQFDANFQRLWDDGAAEVSTYTTERLRGGTLRKATATAIVRRAAFSFDDRVEGDAPKGAQQGDLFPVLQMNWLERYSVGAQACDEMTTSVIALASEDGRAAGAETKTDFSAHSWDGQLFHQLLFDASGVRSHQYSFQKEGDEQITLSYPRDGVSGDALWFWVRGMAAPLVDPGQERRVDLLPELRDVREQHLPLSWRTATLSHKSGIQKTDEFTVRADDGRTETFLVEKTAPYRVVHWQNSAGEHAELVTSSRMKSWR